MASKMALVRKAVPLKAAGVRALSAQAAPQAKHQTYQRLPVEELKTTTLENGLTIHSRENQSPVSRVVIVTKAGSRYEDGSNLGVSHIIRSAAGLSTKGSTTFAITKNIEWVGGNLYAASTRDHLIYTLECNRDHVAGAIKFLNDTVFAPEFRPWELDDATPRLRREVAAFKNNQGAQLMEALHKASFRGGLANSLFIEPTQIGRLRPSQIQEFCATHMTGPRTVVSAVGVDHERLVHVYKQLTKLSSSSADEGAASRFNAHGGEVRVEMSGCANTMVALAMEASGLANAKDALSMEVLKHVLGMSKARVPFAQLQATRLGNAALQAKPTHPFSIGAFTAAYADTGLFGVALAAHPKEVGAVSKAAVSAVRSLAKGNVSDADLTAAKQKAKYALAKRETKPTKQARNAAVQQLTQGAPLSFAQAEKAIDGVSVQDIASIAQKMTRAKPAMAAVGQLYWTPHVDELMQ